MENRAGLNREKVPDKDAVDVVESAANAATRRGLDDVHREEFKRLGVRGRGRSPKT